MMSRLHQRLIGFVLLDNETSIHTRTRQTHTKYLVPYGATLFKLDFISLKLLGA